MILVYIDMKGIAVLWKELPTFDVKGQSTITFIIKYA